MWPRQEVNSSSINGGTSKTATVVNGNARPTKSAKFITLTLDYDPRLGMV